MSIQYVITHTLEGLAPMPWLHRNSGWARVSMFFETHLRIPARGGGRPNPVERAGMIPRPAPYRTGSQWRYRSRWGSTHSFRDPPVRTVGPAQHAVGKVRRRALGAGLTLIASSALGTATVDSAFRQERDQSCRFRLPYHQMERHVFRERTHSQQEQPHRNFIRPEPRVYRKARPFRRGCPPKDTGRQILDHSGIHTSDAPSFIYPHLRMIDYPDCGSRIAKEMLADLLRCRKRGSRHYRDRVRVLQRRLAQYLVDARWHQVAQSQLCFFLAEAARCRPQ
jgi:hypothetical protein